MAKGFEWKNVITDVQRVEDALAGRKTACVFDTETTGIVGKGGIETEDEIKIIQFSGILYALTEDGHLGEQIDTFDTYIFPEEYLSPDVTKVTGITNEDLANAPSEDEVAWQIFHFMNRAQVWIAYNTPYDLNRLKYLAQRTGSSNFKLPSKEKMDISYPTMIDVLPMARNILAPEPLIEFRTNRNKTLPDGEKDAHGVYKLQYVTPVLFPDFEAKFHDSLEDVKSTAKVYNYLLDVYREYQDPFQGKDILAFQTAIFKITNPYHSPYNTRRILIYIQDKENADFCYKESGIFYDVSKQVWTCDSKKESKQLFKSISLPVLEKNVLEWAQKKQLFTYDEFTYPSMLSLTRVMEKNFSNSRAGSWYKKITAEKREKAKKEKILGKIADSFDIELE